MYINIISAGAKRAAYSGVPLMSAWYKPKRDRNIAVPTAMNLPVLFLSSYLNKTGLNYVSFIKI